MKHYLNTMLIGLMIAGLCTSLFMMIYWNAFVVSVILIQGALQGLAAALIYERLRLPYLARFILHALASYLLALVMLILCQKVWQLNLVIFSFYWIIIFAAVFTYFYFSIHREAQKINKKLEEIGHEADKY